MVTTFIAEEEKGSMETLFQELKDIFQAELRIYRQFHELAKEKHSVLTEQSLDRLEEITKKEENLIPELKEWEEKRESVITQLKNSLGIEGKVTLDEIIEKSGSNARDLLALRDELKKEILAGREINDRNRELIESNLDVINRTVETLAQLSKTGKSYSREGKVLRTGEETRTFDTEV